MKIAVTASCNNLDGSVDLRFGRASGFIIYDLENGTFKFKDNIQNLEAVQGAGIQAAQHIINEDASALITGHCGPKAFKVLSAANIKIYVDADGTVRDTIEKFKNNELHEALSPDVEGHWM